MRVLKIRKQFAGPTFICMKAAQLPRKVLSLDMRIWELSTKSEVASLS